MECYFAILRVKRVIKQILNLRMTKIALSISSPEYDPPTTYSDQLTGCASSNPRYITHTIIVNHPAISIFMDILVLLIIYYIYHRI